MFQFTDPTPVQNTRTFTGYTFYNIYKNAEFLRSSANIETILSKEYQLRQSLKGIEPGMAIQVQGMNLEKNTPLLIKKTGENIQVEDFEFTHNRLTGLTAAYAFGKRHRFPVIISSDALKLGLTWDNADTEKSRLYLAAVSGSEHFYDQFSFWPLICALRKLQLGKITVGPVVKIAKIKNNNGVRLAKELKSNLIVATRLWKLFPGSSSSDLKILLKTAPYQLTHLFMED